MTGGEIRLSNKALSLGLLPDLGGSVSRLDLTHPGGDTQALLRAAPDDLPRDASPLDLACFPLFPFSNRIAGANLRFDGEVFALPVNFPPEPHCLHGDAWQHPWSVGERTETSITLTYGSRRLGQPFDYAASQRFTLGESHLRVDLSLTNMGERSMPAGTGLHAYYDKPPNTRLTANLPGVWLSDDRLIPTEHTAVPPEWDFRGGKSLDGVVVDSNFTGWDRAARIDWPDRPFALEIAATRNLGNTVIFSPPGGDFFCFEPVSNANDAFNRGPETYARDGVVVLEPGESLEASVTFTAVPR